MRNLLPILPALFLAAADAPGQQRPELTSTEERLVVSPAELAADFAKDPTVARKKFNPAQPKKGEAITVVVYGEVDHVGPEGVYLKAGAGGKIRVRVTTCRPPPSFPVWIEARGKIEFVDNVVTVGRGEDLVIYFPRKK
jgi:hypothetical protein